MKTKTRNGMTFKGVPKDAALCPIANWLCEAYPHAIVETDNVLVYFTDLVDGLSLNDGDPSIASVAEFVWWFDEGPYDDDEV